MEPEAAFDPLNLDNRVSLNRTVLASYVRPAHELLASHAMRDAISAELPHLDGDDPIVALDAALAGKDPAGQAIAKRFGEYLADLVLTLMTEPSEEPFMQSYREHWAGLSQVFLGGGIAQGSLGQALSRSANGVLDHSGLNGVAVLVAPHAPLLPLVGAARSVEPGVQTAAVLDFGGTSVKRGVATYAKSSLKTLRVLPALPSLPLPPETPPSKLATFMTDVIAADVSESGASDVAVSVACYMRDGQPLDYGSGGYQLLRQVTDNASRYLSDAVSQRLGRRVRVSLSHDGTTAARVFAGQPHTAAIMLGTWLGVGFAPEDASTLRPLAPGFDVTST